MMNLGISNQLSRSLLRGTERANQRTSFQSNEVIKVPNVTENTLILRGVGEAMAYDEDWVHVQLIPDSTEEDPVVRITVLDSRSGDTKHDFTRHIKDIEPRNTTYAEMCALAAWEDKVNPSEKNHTGGLLPVAPVGMWIGNVMQKHNFVDACSRYIASGKFGPNLIEQAKNLLTFYQKTVADGNFPDGGTKATAVSRAAVDQALEELMDALETHDFDGGDVTAYSAYRRMADDALMNLMKLV